MENVEYYDIPKIEKRVYTKEAPVKRQSSEIWESENQKKANRNVLYNDISSGGSGDRFIQNQWQNRTDSETWKTFIDGIKRKMQMGMSLTDLEVEALNGNNSRYGNGRIY